MKFVWILIYKVNTPLIFKFVALYTCMRGTQEKSQVIVKSHLKI